MRWVSRFRVFSEFISILIVFIGFLVLLGWAFDISIFLGPGPGFSTAKSNIGLTFILIGVSLWLLQTRRLNKNNKHMARFLAFAVFLIGFLTLVEYMFNVNIGIDQMLFKEAAGALNTVSPNRMAFTAAFNLCMAGIAIFLMDVKVSGHYRPSNFFAILGFFVSLLALIGYLFGVSLLYMIPQFTAIAIYAAVLFVLLFLALIFARPDSGFMAIGSSKSLVGVLARSMVPAIIFIPIIIGFIGRSGYRVGFYDQSFSYALIALLSIISLILVLWIVIIPLNKAVIKQRKAEVELVKYQDQLEEQIEERTKELQRSNDDLKQFAYVASHDLREPLRMITNFLQLLERRYKDQLDQDANEFIYYAVDGAKRLDKMIKDLLEYSRVTNKKMELQDVDLRDVVHQVQSNLSLLIAENSAQITYDPLPRIAGDKNQMTILLQNLISNSIKYRREQTPQIHISAEKSDYGCVFSVKDNGIGIDPQHLEGIFTIFNRLHPKEEYEGTGIGLAIAQRIVHQHGGEIWAESEPGEGTTFYFTLPCQLNRYSKSLLFSKYSAIGIKIGKE